MISLPAVGIIMIVVACVSLVGGIIICKKLKTDYTILIPVCIIFGMIGFALTVPDAETGKTALVPMGIFWFFYGGASAVLAFLGLFMVGMFGCSEAPNDDSGVITVIVWTCETVAIGIFSIIKLIFGLL